MPSIDHARRFVTEIMHRRAERSVVIESPTSFSVQLTEHYSARFSSDAAGRVTILVAITPAVLTWNISDDGREVTLQPIGVPDDEHRALDVDVTAERAEEQPHREAYRLARLAFALSCTDDAIRIASFSDVDQEYLEKIKMKFDSFDKQAIPQLHKLWRQLGEDESFRKLMNVMAGPIVKSLKIEL